MMLAKTRERARVRKEIYGPTISMHTFVFLGKQCKVHVVKLHVQVVATRYIYLVGAV